MVRPMLDSPATPPDEATAILRRTFGHAAFRGLQAEVIAEALAGRHALAVLPTGGGEHRGTRLTPMGHEVLKAYRALETELVKAAAGPLEALQAKLLDAPRSSQGEASGDKA